MHFGFGTVGAVLAASSAADGQVGTVASTRVEAKAEVRILAEEPDRLLIATGGTTIELTAHSDGSLTLALARSPRASEPGAAAEQAGAEDRLTGGRYEVLSLSVSGGENVTRAASPHLDGQLRVVIANYN